MTHRFKTLVLTSALAIGTLQPASAAFAIRKAPVVATSAAGSAAAVAMPAESFAAPAATSLHGTRTVAKKRGFFNRIGKRITAAAMKSKLVAALLCYFLGTLGIHRFYLGYTKEGLLQLGLGVVGFTVAILGLLSLSVGIYLIGFAILVALGIWVLVDFIRILTGSLEPMDGSYD